MKESLGQSLLHRLLNLRNAVDYPLRQLFHLRRGAARLHYRPHDNLFAHLPDADRQKAIQITADLKNRYHLDGFEAASNPINYRENLFYLSIIEGALNSGGSNLPDSVQAADIGPSHWFYVQALYAALRWWRCTTGRSVSLQGFEIDPYRVYNDFHSRYDHAQAHMRGLQGVQYIPQGFETQPAAFDLITLFFPFVFVHDHLEWGLPNGLFHPDQVIESAWQSLKPSGILMIVNQGTEEHQAERQSLDRLGIPIQAAYQQDPLLFHYDHLRYVLVSRHAG